MPKPIEEFAALGGSPAFAEPLHVGRPNIGSRDALLTRINDILDRRWLTNKGAYVQAFEEAVAECCDVKHCIAMCNGTIALEIAMRALGFTGEVIVPSFTFVATAHALQWQEISPVFCDVEPGGFLIDPAQVEMLITPRTTGIVGVHLWGRACNIDALQEIARRHHLKLLFDAAHALGCTSHGRKIGSFGNAEVLSFHATKFVNSFEGGAVLTNCDDLARRIRLMKNFGFEGNDNVTYIGTNGKMCEVSAAMGLTSLESMDEFVEINQRNFETYQTALANTPGIALIPYDPDETTNYQYVIARVNADTAGLSRDRLVEVLQRENVFARRYFFPGCHCMEPYRSMTPDLGKRLPHTEQLAADVIALPTGTAVSTEEVETVCSLIRTAIQHADRF